MKKSIIAALAMALVLCGCGSTPEPIPVTEDGPMVAITDAVTQAQTTETAAETVKPTERGTETTRKNTTTAEKITTVTTTTTDAEETETDEEDETGFTLFTAEYKGVYAETGSKKATIELVPDLDGSYAVLVNWTNSAADTFAWTFEGVFEDGKLAYDNAIKTHIVFDENDKSTTETIYSGGTGFIEIRDNVLTWKDDKEKIADGLQFKLAK